MVQIYDTTLRDGTQREGISLSCEDKLRIARCLDDLGVAFIEGGWPGSNPKDA
ncbi:MAG TPA: citramalate synthase, partial [Anaeromyxobacter sp.]|nr:citramalate synthase [Anaeromyxobacter sp.]